MKFYTIMNVNYIYRKKCELSIIRCLVNSIAEALFFIG